MRVLEQNERRATDHAVPSRLEHAVALTPNDIRARQFRVVLRGYAVDEVDAFLDHVERELRHLLAHGDPSAEHGGVPVTASGDPAVVAVRTLRLAEQTADALLAEARDDAERETAAARDEAGRLLGEAREEAERLVAAARSEAARIDVEAQQQRHRELGDVERLRGELADEVERLAELERAYRDRLERMLRAQLSALQQGDRRDEPIHLVAP